MTTIPHPSTLINHPQFAATVRRIAHRAAAAIPQHEGRVDSAVAIVLAGALEPAADGTALVASQSRMGHAYHVNSVCECEDAQHGACAGLCKHRLAWGIYRRTVEALAQESHSPAGPPVEDHAPGNLKVPAQYLVMIQGKLSIKYAGLLHLAHERGLVSLVATWTSNEAELSLAYAVAIFADGRRFEECGDATPTNVTKKVAPHFRRVALTRSKARALRDALSIDLVAVEELGEME